MLTIKINPLAHTVICQHTDEEGQPLSTHAFDHNSLKWSYDGNAALPIELEILSLAWGSMPIADIETELIYHGWLPGNNRLYKKPQKLVPILPKDDRKTIHNLLNISNLSINTLLHLAGLTPRTLTKMLMHLPITPTPDGRHYAKAILGLLIYLIPQAEQALELTEQALEIHVHTDAVDSLVIGLADAYDNPVVVLINDRFDDAYPF